MASWLVRSTSERAVRVRALVGDIVLCSWARHFTLTVPLSTQVYKWVPANLMLGVTLRWTSIPSIVASCYGNRDKLRPGGPHWPVCRLTVENGHIYSSVKEEEVFIYWVYLGIFCRYVRLRILRAGLIVLSN